MATNATPVSASLMEDLGRLFASDREALADPYPLFRRLRAEAPVLRYGPLVVVSRYVDVQNILRNPAVFSSVRGLGTRVSVRKAQLDAEGQRKLQELVDHESLWLTENDDPDHARLRKLANHAFTPKRIAQMRDDIQAIMDELLAPADERGTLELVSELAFRLPLRVICRMLGASPDRADDLRRWSGELALALSTDYSNVDAAHDAYVSFRDYVLELIEERRHEETEDLFSVLIQAEQDGDQLSNDELVGMFVLLLFAGHETTTNLIGNSMAALLRNPEQLRILREDPALVRPAVEEFLRYCSSVHAIHRVATADTELHGVPIHAGESVRLMLTAANHDEEVFQDPDILDVRRASAGRHLGFGFGIHTCLGAWLARLETEIAITTLITRYPDLALDGEVVMRPSFLLTGPEAVHLTLR